MFTVDELRAMQKQADRWLILRFFAFLAPAVVGYILSAILISKFEPSLDTWIDRNADDEVALGGLTFMIVVGPPIVVTLIYWLIVRMNWVRLDPPAYHCPRCGEAWDGLQLILESGNCHRCGRRVAEAPAIGRAEDTSGPRVPMETFASNARIGEVTMQRLVSRFIGFGFFLCFALLISSLVFKKTRLFSNADVSTLCLSLVMLIFFGSLIFLAYKENQIRTRFGLKCPNCQKSLLRRTSSVIAMRKCSSCKMRILNEPEA
ncbi:MAG: hypothetical protein ACJ8C4_04875 [Gemmataceae bacterium]